MKPIVVLASVTAALLVGTGIYSVTANEDSPVGVVTDSTDNPFAGLEGIFSEEGMMSELTAEETQAEDDYLRINLSQKPDAESLTAERSSTANIPYQSCEMDPYVANRKVFMASGEEAMVRRSIYGVARFQHTLDTGDCTCVGKVAPFSLVDETIAELVRTDGPDWDRQAVSDEYRRRYEELRPHVMAFCGGDF